MNWTQILNFPDFRMSLIGLGSHRHADPWLLHYIGETEPAGFWAAGNPKHPGLSIIVSFQTTLPEIQFAGNSLWKDLGLPSYLGKDINCKQSTSCLRSACIATFAAKNRSKDKGSTCPENCSNRQFSEKQRNHFNTANVGNTDFDAMTSPMKRRVFNTDSSFDGCIYCAQIL